MITIMNHSVGLQNHSWYAAHVAESAADFDRQCSAYRRSARKTVFMREAWLKKNDRNLLFLNFDDGYLDNWVHAMPILQHYGLKGTVYVTSDFIDPREIIRPQVSREGSLEEPHRASDCCAGFLSVPEMRKMEESGVMEIQAHAQTHTWYAKGPGIIDFWRPGSAVEKDGPIWMLWNAYPDRKPFYLTEAPKQESLIAYGTPVLENGKSLETRRFFPEPAALQDLTGLLTACVTVHGGTEFFQADPNWRRPLREIVDRFGELPGRHERDEEYLERVRCELRTVKEKLERELQKSVKGICWPGGGVSPGVVEIARTLGYEYFTMPSRWHLGNCPPEYSHFLARTGLPRFITVHGRRLRPMSETDILLNFRSVDGHWWERNYPWRLRQILALCGI